MAEETKLQEPNAVLTTTLDVQDPLLLKLKAEKDAAINLQKHRHEAWKDNYALFRDIVEINELTQRQALSIPLMKETKKTIFSQIDEPPSVKFECKEEGVKGRQKDLYVNSLWDDDVERCNFEAIDVMQKNNVLLYGRTFAMLNFSNSEFSTSVPNNLDIVIDPKVLPYDIETAKWIVRLHINKSLREILASPKYEENGKQQLKEYLQKSRGLIAFKDDATQQTKDDILRTLGIDNYDTMHVADIEIEMNEHFTLIWDPKQKKFVRHVVLVGQENAILYKKTLKETIGVEFWPFITWGDEIDNNDFWNDGIADIVRVPNQVANIYFSTYTENMVLRSLGMYWYLPVPGYNPNTFTPTPFGQYPAPLVKNTDGSYMTVEQVIKKMDIPELSQNMVNIEFLVKIVERATAATAIQKGIQETGPVTATEVKELAAATASKMLSMAKYYRRAWKEYAWKWYALRAANASKTKPLTLSKKSPDGGYQETKLYPSDWISKKGFVPTVTSSSEQEAKQLRDVQKVIMVQKQLPNNMAFQKIARKRLMGMLNLTPEEEKEVEAEEEAKAKAASAVVPAGGVVPPAAGAAPSVPIK